MPIVERGIPTYKYLLATDDDFTVKRFTRVGVKFPVGEHWVGCHRMSSKNCEFYEFWRRGVADSRGEYTKPEWEITLNFKERHVSLIGKKSVLAYTPIEILEFVQNAFRARGLHVA